MFQHHKHPIRTRTAQHKHTALPSPPSPVSVSRLITATCLGAWERGAVLEHSRQLLSCLEAPGSKQGHVEQHRAATAPRIHHLPCKGNRLVGAGKFGCQAHRQWAGVNTISMGVS